MAEDLKKLVEKGISKGYSLEKIQSDFANAGWGEAYLNNIPVYYNEFKKKSPVGAKDAGVLPSRQGDTRFSSESQLQQDKYAGVGNIPLSDPLLKKKDGLADSLFKILNQAQKDADNTNKYVPQIQKLWNDYSSIERGQKETQNIFDERGRLNKLALSSLNASAKRNSDRVKEEAKAIAKDDGVLETAARGFYGGILGAADYVANLFDPDTYDDQPDAPDSLGLEAKRQLERAQKASLGRKLSAGYTEKQIEDGFIGNFTNGNYGAAFDLFGRDLIEVLPQSAVGFIPYVGLPLMAASAGGGGWQAVKDDDKYSTLEKFLYAPLVGAAEYATEKFFGMDRRMVQKGLSEAFGKTIKSGADIPKKELGDMLFGGIPKAVRAPLEEGLEEGIVTTFTQTLDKIMADKPFDPVEIAESVMLGAGAGGSTYALVRGGSALLQTPVFNDVYTITNNVNKINELLQSDDIVPEEKEILSNRLNQFKTQLNQLRNEASDYYKPFSQEDKQKTLELNQAITKGMKTYGAMKTPEAKAEVVNTIRQSLAEKAQIEQKYDSAQKQQVPSTVVQGAQPGGVPIQGTSAEAPQAGGVLQVPSQQEEEIASKAKVIENSSPAFSFKPVSVTLTENNAPEVIGNITTYVDTIPDELFKTLSTSRQEVMNGVESISNVISSLSKSGRQVPVTVYATEDAWKRGTGQPLSRGIYVESEVEGQPSSISVFLPAIVGNTVYHEGLHDVVPKVFGAKGIETVAKRLSQAVKQDPLLAAQLGQFVSNYEQSDKAEEFLAELGSRVSAGDIDIEVTKSLATRFMEAVASVLGAVGIKMSPNASQLSRAFLEYAQKLGAGVELGEIETEREVETRVRRQALGLRRKEESLVEFGLPTNKRPNNREVGQALELRQRKKYKKIKPNDFSDKSADIISDYMVDEIIFEVEALGKNSAVGWYGPKFQEALDELARVTPSMRNQSDRNLFTMLVAITSDGQKVENNFTYALSLYNSYVKNGVVSQEFSFGADRNTSMKSNVQEINRLLKQSNGDLTNINDILLERMRYGDIKKKYGVKDDFTETDTKKANKSDYKVDTMMPVSAGIFGPKLGAFYANLSGQEEYLTMDRWWNRTFNRYRGTLLPTISEKGLERFKSLVGLPPTTRKSTALKEVTKYANAYKKKKFKDGTEIEKAANTIYKAAFTELNDSPSGAGEREFMIKTANKAKDKLSKAGYDLTVADVQAVLWYFEKRLYAEIKNTKFAMDIDYSDAMRKIVSNDEKLKILPNQIGKGKVESEQEMVDIIDSPTNNLIQLDDVVDLEAVNNATETINKAQERPSPRKVMRMALEGYNEKPQAMAGQRLFNEPLKEAAAIADEYYEKEFNEARPKFNGIKSVDKERAKKISDAYVRMEDNYFDPEVKKAYDAMIDETLKQFDFIVDKGYKVVINNKDDYKTSEDMISDLRDNKVMRIFSTESGFGDDPITENQRDSNPLLKDSGRKDKNGVPLLNNDLFRFVHDFFGHAELGNGFGAVGEENAWNVHARMYSPLARKAMTSETRGQNSYVNFSGINEEVFKIRDKAREERKKGNEAEADKLLNEVKEKMKFADQKVGLLPEEMAIPDGFEDTKPKAKQQEAPTKKAMLQIIGSNADLKEWTSKMLLKANEMERRGVKPKTIFNVTGWERGADKKWKYPVPPFKLDYTKVAQFNEGPIGNTVNLYDLIENNGRFKSEFSSGIEYYAHSNEGRTKENEDVFDFYPSFANMKVTLSETNGPTFFRYVKMPGQKALGSITISKYWHDKSPDHFLFALTHEIQHAVQREEGFAVGGSVATVDEEIDKVIEEDKKILANKEKLIPALKDRIKLEEEKVQWYIDNGYSQRDILNDGVLNTLEGLNIQLRMIEDTERQLAYLKGVRASKDLSKRDKYVALAGEIEANNAAKRAVAAVAKGGPTIQMLVETEDIPREYQIIITPDIEEVSSPAYLKKLKAQKISKAQGSQLDAQIYSYLLSISEKQPDNTYKLPFTLEDFLSYMVPTFSRQRATEIYENVSKGITPEKVVKSVPNIDDAYEASKKLLDSQKNKKMFTWDAARKFFLDRQATLKAAILKAGMKNAYNLLVNRAGSGARASYFFSKQEKAIYDGLNSKDIEALDKIIMLRRIAEIDKNFDTRGENRPIHPNKLNFESAQIGLAEKRKELGDAKFNELNDKANKYFDAFKSLLDSMYEEGLINEDLYNRLKDLDYQPRMFIEHVFDMDELSMRDINLSANQVKKIKDGSEDEIMFDSRFLLAVYSKSTFSRIARNKVNRAIAEATSVKGNEEWISKDPKKQFSEVTYFEDGVRKQFYIKSSLKGELDDVQRFGVIPPESQKYVGLLSGSYLLKLLATRANPLFVFRNVPRDYLHVLFFTNVYDNMNMPLAMYRLAGDAIKGVKGKIKDDQDYKDFIEYGGGMEYLSTEGKEGMMTNRGLLNKTIEKLGSAGELSEIAFRLGMYKRLVQESLKNFDGTPNEEQLAQIKVEAVTKSREMIDFAQGGVATKTLESAVPYINAAFQGFRVSSAYIKNNPKEFVIKLGQLAIGLAVIAMYNAVMGDDDMEDIPEDVKRRYFIIMTPFTEEKDGKTVKKYIKIAKTQQLIPFISALDMSLESNLVAPFMGRDARFNEETAKQSWDAFLSYFPKDPSKPLDEALSSVPLFSALAAYKMNYDTFRKRIISTDYQDKNVLPAYEDFTDKNVPYFYKAIGQAVDAGPKRLQVATEKFITTPYSSIITMGGYTLMDAIASNVYELKGPGGYTPAEQETISNKALKSAGINVEKVFIGTTDPNHKIYNKREQIERINLEASTERKGLKLQAKELGGKYFTAKEQGDSKGMNEALEAIRNARIEVRDKAVEDKNKQDYDYFNDALKTNMRFGPTFPQEYNDITFATDNEARAKIIAIRDMNMTQKELIDYLVDYKRKTGKSIDIRTIIREYDKFVTNEKK